MKYVYAGDRAISVNILKFLIAHGYRPSALLVSEGSGASHANELIELADLPPDCVFKGNAFKQEQSIDFFRKMDLDYIFGIHFPYLVPKKVLDIPKVGVLNLHPAYLPFNKGWHTPSWAIIEGDPYGATLHFMEEALDQGDIIHQKQLAVQPEDTANTLYQRALATEEEVFYEAFDEIVSLKPKRFAQSEAGTAHVKKDLELIQEINLEQNYTGQEIINKLRALTTNSFGEAAFFIDQGKKVSIQVTLKEI